MRRTLTMVMVLLLTGCATGARSGAESPGYREQDRINRYVDFQTACNRGNGVVIVHGGMDRVRDARIPDRTARYGCRQRNDMMGGTIF